MKKQKILQKFLGCVFGGAVADAFTLPYQGIFTKDLLQSLSIDTTKYRKTKNNEKGKINAPTLFTLAVIKSIINKTKLNDMDVLAEFKILYETENITGDIFQTKQAIENAIQGKKWEQIPVRVGIADCSTAYRSAPVGLWNYNNKEKDIVSQTSELSKLTHKDYRATCAAILVSAATQFLVNAKPKFNNTEFLKYIYDVLKLEDEKAAKYLLELKNVFKKQDKELALIKIYKLGNHSYSIYEQGGGVPTFSLSVVFTAIYHFLNNKNDFEKMLQDIVHTSGAINSLGPIAGNLWGALNGYDALPVQLVDNLQEKEDIYSLTVKFFKTKHKIRN